MPSIFDGHLLLFMRQRII